MGDIQHYCQRRKACIQLSMKITTVLSYPDLMAKLMSMFRVDNDDIKAEICYIFSNMTHLSIHLDLERLFCEYGVIECFLELLSSKNCRVVVKGLKTLNVIMRMSDRKKAE